MQIPSRVQSQISPLLSWKMDRTELSGRPSSVLKLRKWKGCSWAWKGRESVMRMVRMTVFFIFRSLDGKLAIFPFKIGSKVLKNLSDGGSCDENSLKMIDF